MPMKFSTGKGTRMRHSTAMDWDEWEKKRRHPWLRYSTSKEGVTRHSTGTMFDLETPSDLDGERERLWVRCPDCQRLALRRQLVKKGCYVCGWCGPEEELPPAFAKDDPAFAGGQGKRGQRTGVRSSKGLRSKPEAEGDEYLTEYAAARAKRQKES